MQPYPGKLVFLVYDSRSGSTLLSRELAQAFADVVVTPEAYLGPVLRRGNRSLWPRPIVDDLERKQHIANLSVDTEKLGSELEQYKGELTVDVVIRYVVALHLQSIGRADARVVIIKKGNHLGWWKTIARRVSNAELLHIVRDPRATINSKLRTKRPYHPYEVMAWGGALLAALQWRRIMGSARNAATALPVTVARYEDLLNDRQALLGHIGSALRLQPASASPGPGYEVPESEQRIHQRVRHAGLDPQRAEAWRSELRNRDRIVIESLCYEEMQRYGYSDRMKCNWITRLTLLGLGIAETLLLTARHFALRWKWRIQRA